ncbi:hypothetical protein, partial [Shewanella sp.]|uniref:hypothetical protein n=1 Tax=Shewanella sp. TaxID=50422 RepID=UPI0040539B94
VCCTLQLKPYRFSLKVSVLDPDFCGLRLEKIFPSVIFQMNQSDKRKFLANIQVPRIDKC